MTLNTLEKLGAERACARGTIAALVSLLAALSAPAVQAATTAGNLQVSATVVSACLVSGATMSFGNSIDPTVANVPIDASATMTVQCTSTTPYAVSLDAGANAGGLANFTSRAIKNGSHTLGYQLYLDAIRSVIWGNGTASSVLPGTGTGANQSLTIYGRLPSLVGAVPGNYTDTVTVTVTY